MYELLDIVVPPLAVTLHDRSYDTDVDLGRAAVGATTRASSNIAPTRSSMEYRFDLRMMHPLLSTQHDPDCSVFAYLAHHATDGRLRGAHCGHPLDAHSQVIANL